MIELLPGIWISERTKDRLKQDIIRGDYRRFNRLIHRKLIYPNYSRNNPASFQQEQKAYSYSTEQRRRKDIRLGIPTTDRPDFVAWDGEGREIDNEHKYILLANSNKDRLIRESGITTIEALDFLKENTRKRTINIFYSFGYDIQQIVKDVPDFKLDRLLHGFQIYYEGYWLQYFPNKIFTINHHIRFYDIFNFFHTSFIKAISGTLGNDYISKRLVVGKEARSDFTAWKLEKIIEYNDIELDLLRQLGERLRDIFSAADIELRSSYYGPGAIAKYWFNKYKVKPIKVEDGHLQDILERAYYGGRFETFYLGKQEPVFECDIHSAYPAVIATLQYVDDWQIVESKHYNQASPFSIWRVEWHLPNNTRIGPLPSRDKHGLISYPANGKGWYYKSELDAAIDLYDSSIQILEGIEPQKIWGHPFDWVWNVFNRRTELKEQKNPAEWALKVGMNSLYGKTAQRVGSNKFFCLPWAGYITATTRGKLLRTTKGSSSSIIAFATDAVYSTTRLSNLDYGSQLGQFEIKHWEYGYFLQSGVYRLIGKETKDAYRGFNSKDGLSSIFNQIQESQYKPPSITQTHFVTHSQAIKFPNAFGKYRLRFIKIKKELAPYKPVKRIVPYEPNGINDDLFYFADSFDSSDDGAEEEDAITWFTTNKIPVGIWANYKPLLERSIDTRILENMNDHRHRIYGNKELGEFEESYPFVKLLPSIEKELNGLPDEIAYDRLGGATGKIPNRSDPILLERQVLENLS